MMRSVVPRNDEFVVLGGRHKMPARFLESSHSRGRGYRQHTRSDRLIGLRRQRWNICIPLGKSRAHNLARLAATALATSIDACAVGVSLAILHVNIITACLVIGAVTTVVATVGVLLGKHVGAILGRYAELLGGLALIGIGGAILFQHLSGQA